MDGWVCINYRYIQSEWNENVVENRANLFLKPLCTPYKSTLYCYLYPKAHFVRCFVLWNDVESSSWKVLSHKHYHQVKYESNLFTFNETSLCVGCVKLLITRKVEAINYPMKKKSNPATNN